ncbi:MAG: carboxymuconolactone decarboxylase family protein [Nitrospira sp.]|jgi:AhpD family alkylhydroperoxidase|nr:carboxymuconolactone decarboxylase family protein [Nitrospira sp.]
MNQSTTDETELFAELRKLSPKVTGGLLRMRQEAYRDAAVPAKYKLLAALTISIVIRCEPCIRAYVRLVCENGGSQEELIEFLEVAMTMQGCPGEEWALKAYKIYKEQVSGTQSSDGNMCCAH